MHKYIAQRCQIIMYRIFTLLWIWLCKGGSFRRHGGLTTPDISHCCQTFHFLNLTKVITFSVSPELLRNLACSRLERTCLPSSLFIIVSKIIFRDRATTVCNNSGETEDIVPFCFEFSNPVSKKCKLQIYFLEKCKVRFFCQW